MDNVAVLKDAKNVENAKLFQNFIMDPENAAMISSFRALRQWHQGFGEVHAGRYEDGARSRIFQPDVMAHGTFTPTCPPEVTEIYTKIWTELLK